jgi:hypothetical protein
MDLDYGAIMAFIGFFFLLIVLYVSIVRWVLRINDIVSHLNKINEKLNRIEQQRTTSKE